MGDFLLVRRGMARTGAVGAVLAAVALPGSATANYETVSEGFVVPDSSLGQNDVQCSGGGDIAISGGLENGGPISESMWMDSSRPGSLANPTDAGSWTGRYHDIDDFSEATPPATVRAVCDVDGAGDYRIRRTEDVKLKPIRQVKYLKKCRDGEAVVGGGLELNDPAVDAFPTTSTPRDDRDRDRRPDGWYVVVDTQHLDTAQARMDVYAVCDRTRSAKRYRYKTSTAQVPDGLQAETGASCPVLPEEEPRVGGGIAARTKLKHQLRINSSYPESGGGGAWFGFVDNVDTPDNESRAIIATAICLK
jgi:hypothetical protein